MGVRRVYRGFVFGAHPETLVRYARSGLTVKGTVCWTLSGAWNQSRVGNYLAQWDLKKSYKIGLRIKRGQDIRLSYRGYDGKQVPLRRDGRVEGELKRLFGAPRGEKWIGFVPASRDRRWFTFEPPNLVRFEITVSIAPADSRPQMIPYVGRHPDDSFRAGYMPGLWVLPPRPR